MNNNNLITTSLLLSVLMYILYSTPASAQKSCEGCARKAILDEFTNPNNPDYEQKREAWRQCMQDQLGDYVSFDADDPKVNDAAANCEQFEPTDNAYCFPAIVAAFLGEHLTNPCFHMLSLQYFNPDMHRNPEYLFKGSYEGNLEGGRIVEAVTDVFKPIIARMNMRLYYNGTTPELVHEWYSEGTLNSPKGLLNKLSLPKNISPMLEEFEKKPVKCDVEIPSPEEICEHGTGEIVLSNFTDSKGNTSKPFNRIVVSIFKGEILNGEKSIFGPDYRVFTLEEGEVKVKYRPPAEKEDGYEWLRVYNSCEILPPEKSPMAETKFDELIIDQHFTINCGFYEGTITITKSWDYTKHYDDYSSTRTGSQTVTVSGIFKPIPQMEGMEGQPVKIFGKGNSLGTWRHNERHYCEGKGCGDCKGLVYEEYGSGSISSMTMDGVMIITNVWPTENKTVADQLKQFGMENFYDIMIPSETVETQNRIKSDTRDGGCQWNNSNTTNVLTECSVRYKLKDIELLQGRESWSSKSETTAISITNLTDAIYDQKPYDPEQNGNDYTYSITWNLKAF